jgi:hypothetical protein
MKKQLFLFAICLLHYSVNSQTTYMWSNGATTQSIDVNPSQTTTYYVTISDNGTTYYDSVVVYVNTTPTISGATSVCKDASIQLTSNGAPATTNPWSSSDNAIASVTNTGLVTGISAGAAIITFTSADGCQTTQEILVNAIVSPAFTQMGPYSIGATVPTLPTSSNNGIIGTWAPIGINNTTSGTYTFTPAAGQCALTAVMTIAIQPLSYSLTRSNDSICSGGNVTLSVNLLSNNGTISNLYCNSVNTNGNLTSNSPTNNVGFNINYNGGDGGAYGSQTINSTGVTGLTASLSSGNFADGYGALTFSISGIANNSGTAKFNLNVGGQTCEVSIGVNPSVPNNLAVGNSFGGGIVAYIFQPSDFGFVQNETHGIIVANEDLPNPLSFGGGTSLSLISNSIGYGKSNSNVFMNIADTTNAGFPAVQGALNYVSNGYEDWFLGSLNDMLIVRDNLALNSIGNFSPAHYWSSSLMDNVVGALAPAFVQGGGVCGCAYFESYLVRPVRYF